MRIAITPTNFGLVENVIAHSTGSSPVGSGRAFILTNGAVVDIEYPVTQSTNSLRTYVVHGGGIGVALTCERDQEALVKEILGVL